MKHSLQIKSKFVSLAYSRQLKVLPGVDGKHFINTVQNTVMMFLFLDFVLEITKLAAPFSLILKVNLKRLEALQCLIANQLIPVYTSKELHARVFSVCV